jgi:hypothetical protein
VSASTKFKLVGEGKRCWVLGWLRSLPVDRDYVEVHVEK